MAFFEKNQFKADSFNKKFSCISCGLYKTCKTARMSPTGNFKKQILIVTEFPNESADQNGRPLAGRQERFLKGKLKKEGIDLWEDCIVTSALRCKPKKKIEKSSLLACKKYVLSTIKKYEPKVIILFGQFALESVIGSLWKKDLGSIDKWRGFHIPEQIYKAWICPIYGINSVLNGEEEMELIFDQDISNIKRFLHKKVPPYKSPTIDYIDDLSVLSEIKSSLISFDYETTGIKPHEIGHEILCASVADTPDHVFTFKMPKEEELRKPFTDLLKNQTIQKMAHNMKYEDTWSIIRLNTKVENWAFDSQLAAHIIDNRSNITSLKFQTFVRLGVADYDSEITPYISAPTNNSFNKFKEYMQTSTGTHNVLKYCAYDSINQYRISVEMMKEMQYDLFLF